MFKSNFNDEERIFNILRTTNKITHDFSVNVEEKDAFLHWVKVLSSTELMVDVDLNDIVTREFSKYKNKLKRDFVLFKIKVSGEEKNVERWRDNLNCVSNFLKGNYELEYLTKNREKEND